MCLQKSWISIAAQTVLVALLISLAGCKSKQKEDSAGTFATPEEAGAALQAAAKADNEAALTAIFGPGSKDVISSGDPVQDKNTAAKFSAAYDVMHRWRKLDESSQILLVGYDNFAFPI